MKVKVINNIMGKGTEDISGKLQEIFESEEQNELNIIPIFVIKYLKDKKTGKLISHQTYGVLSSPVKIFNEYDEGDHSVSIEMKHNKLYSRKGNGNWQELKETRTIDILISSNLIDAEKYIQEQTNMGKRNIQLPIGENVVNMYIGDSAYKLLERMNTNK